MSTPDPLVDALGLDRPAIAVMFRDQPPESLERVDAAGPTGCSYWADAAGGRSFYTEAEDHYGCPLGAHTHGVTLPDEVRAQAQGLVDLMVGSEYVSEEELGQIPGLAEPARIVVYAPFAAATGEVDVVIVRGNARQMMVLAEAVHQAGAMEPGMPWGRPTCAFIPEVMRTGKAAFSLGCIGNRVYTSLDDGESYAALPGSAVPAILERLQVLAPANDQIEALHRTRI